MSTPNTVKAQLQNLIDISNRFTGKSDTDLTGAVNTLVNERESLLDGNITEFYSETPILKDYGLSYLDYLVNITLPNVTEIGYNALGNNSSLKNVNIPKARVFGSYSFAKDIALEYINLPSANSINSRIFNDCTALKYINLHKAQYISTNVFMNCSSLKVLVFTNETKITSLNNVNALTNTPIESGTGYIYVPRAQIENYKTATNWTVYASQFRALEDYTVDGTIDGELDWDKVNGGTA